MSKPTCHRCPTRCAGMEIDGEVECATSPHNQLIDAIVADLTELRDWKAANASRETNMAINECIFRVLKRRTT